MTTHARRGGGRGRGLQAALPLVLGLGLTLGACTAAEVEPGDGPGPAQVDIRGAQVLTPPATVEDEAPPLGVPKPKRSPDEARVQEREE